MTTEEDRSTYVCKPEEETILFLQKIDKQWSNDLGYLLGRYLEEDFFPFPEGKTRDYYEKILDRTESCEITAFPQGMPKEAPRNFSKIYIKRILSPEEWGMSPFRTREAIVSKFEKIYFNYFDYADAFKRVFYYENPKRTHSWMIKINPEIFKNNHYPEWLKEWWNTMGPPIEILPEPYKGLYSLWLQYTPTIQHEGYVEGSASLFFYMQIGLPWIWKWAPNVGPNKQGLQCLKRKFYCKFWSRLNYQDSENPARRIGWELEETIQKIITADRIQTESNRQRERIQTSLFEQISQKIKIRNPTISDQDLMIEYLKEVGGDFISNCKKHLDKSPWSENSDTTMKDGENKTAPVTEGTQQQSQQSPVLAGESQKPEGDADLSVEELWEDFVGSIRFKAQEKEKADKEGRPSQFH